MPSKGPHSHCLVTVPYFPKQTKPTSHFTPHLSIFPSLPHEGIIIPSLPLLLPTLGSLHVLCGSRQPPTSLIPLSPHFLTSPSSSHSWLPLYLSWIARVRSWRVPSAGGGARPWGWMQTPQSRPRNLGIGCEWQDITRRNRSGITGTR